MQITASDSCLLLTGAHHDDDPGLDWRGVVDWFLCICCVWPISRTGEGHGAFHPHHPSRPLSGLTPMQIAIVKLQPKRRCRIPRRPHPNLDYFFGRLERTEGEMRDDAGPETANLDHPFRSPRRH